MLQYSVAVYNSKQIMETNPELTVTIIPNDPAIPEAQANIFGTITSPSQRPIGSEYVGALVPRSDGTVHFLPSDSRINSYPVNIAGENAPDFVQRLFANGKCVQPVKISGLVR